MRHSVIALIASLALAALAGCADPLIGAYTYTGTGTTTLTLPVANTSSRTTQGTISITPLASGADYQIDAVESGASDHCVLRANRNGSGLIVVPGQSCQFPVTSGAISGSVTATISTGSGVLTGNALTLSVQYAFSGNLGALAVAGTSSQVLNATRAGN